VTAEPSPDNAHRSRAILVLLVLALAIRLAWGLSRPADDASLNSLPDQHEYLQLARNLVHGQGLAFLDSRFNDTVRAFRTPGYPLMLAACGGNVRAIRIVQALLDTSTVLAIYLLASCFMSGRAGPLIAAVVVAFNPYLIYFSGLILSETLFAAMLAWAMLLLARGSLSPSRCQWILGGFVLGLSVLVRPSAVALPVLLGLLSVFLNRTILPSYQEDARPHSAWRLPPGLMMVILTVLCLLPWVIRNRVVLGRWIWLDTNSGFTLYDGYNPDATGGSDQSFIDRQPELQVLGEVQRDEYLSQEATAYARAHPRRVLELIGAKLGRTWSPVPLSQEYGRPGLRMIALAYSLPFDALVLFGLFRGQLARSAKLFLLAPAIYFTIVHALTVGSLRYRIPAEPPLAVLVAGLASGGAMPWRRPETD
jgi:4-amino-4-deoxy-L-arabinose transferase-like glycosyltransferase